MLPGHSFRVTVEGDALWEESLALALRPDRGRSASYVTLHTPPLPSVYGAACIDGVAAPRLPCSFDVRPCPILLEIR